MNGPRSRAYQYAGPDFEVGIVNVVFVFLKRFLFRRVLIAL